MAAGECAVLYVLLNLLVVNFVTVVHRFELTVRVVDGVSSAPLPGAAVSWSGESARLGVTDADGVLVVTRAIQQQPWWMWPRVGRLALHELAMQIEAPSRRRQVIALAEALPSVPLANPFGALRVALQPE